MHLFVFALHSPRFTQGIYTCFLQLSFFLFISLLASSATMNGLASARQKVPRPSQQGHRLPPEQEVQRKKNEERRIELVQLAQAVHRLCKARGWPLVLVERQADGSDQSLWPRPIVSDKTNRTPFSKPRHQIASMRQYSSKGTEVFKLAGLVEIECVSHSEAAPDPPNSSWHGLQVTKTTVSPSLPRGQYPMALALLLAGMLLAAQSTNLLYVVFPCDEGPA